MIWGGSTSVGCNALQLAKAAGYEVITTASPANFEYLKKLGASEVFDYNSSSVKEDLISAFNGKEVVGAVANAAPDPVDHVRTSMSLVSCPLSSKSLPTLSYHVLLL